MTTTKARTAFQITKYNAAEIRKALADYDKQAANKTDMCNLQEQLSNEVVELKSSDPVNPSQAVMASIGFKSLQLEMLPPRIEASEKTLDELEQKIGELFENGLRPAVETLISSESARVRAEIVEQTKAAFQSLAQAQYQAACAPRYQAVARVWVHSHHRPLLNLVRTALAVLDRFDREGTLEKGEPQS